MEKKNPTSWRGDRDGRGKVRVQDELNDEIINRTRRRLADKNNVTTSIQCFPLVLFDKGGR